MPPVFHPARAARFASELEPAIGWIEVAGDAERLRGWLGEAELPVRVVDGSPGVRAVAIAGRELRVPAVSER